MAHHFPLDASKSRNKGRPGCNVDKSVASDDLVEIEQIPGPGGESSTAAVRKAYRENYHHLYQYANGIVGSRELAHDSVQQAFANTLTTVERGGKIENMGGFLKRAVRNVCLDQIRRVQPLSLEHELPLERETDFRLDRSTAASAELKDQWHRVRSAVDELPPNQRRAFVLVELRGLGYVEIAKLMDRSTESVRQLLSRARQKVRSSVGTGSEWSSGTILLRPEKILVHRSQTAVERSLTYVREKAFEAQSWIGNFINQSMDSAVQPAVPIVAGIAIVVGAGPSGLFHPPIDAGPISAKPPASIDHGKVDTNPGVVQDPADSPASRRDPDGSGSNLNKAPIDKHPADAARPTPGRQTPIDGANPDGEKERPADAGDQSPGDPEAEMVTQISAVAGVATPPYGRPGGGDQGGPVGGPIGMMQPADDSGDNSEDQGDEPASDVGVGDADPQADEPNRSSKYDALLKRKREGEELEPGRFSDHQDPNIQRPAIGQR